MKQLVFLALLSLMTVCVSSFAQVSATTRVMLLGDSLTDQGVGREPLYEMLSAEGYRFEFVGSRGQAPLKHEGHSGFTIGPDESKPGNLSANVETWIQDAKPDVIFLLVGNNDYNGKAGVDPAGAPDRLVNLIDKITTVAPEAEVIVSTGLKIAHAHDYAGVLNRKIPGIVADFQKNGRKVHLADLNAELDFVKGAPPFNGSDSDYVDGTHLNAVGGKKLAQARYAHLIPFLTKAEK